MQIHFYKKLFIFLFGIALALPKMAYSISPKELKTADSLFAMAKYTEAEVLYKKNFQTTEKNNAALLLKLAFISEKRNNYTSCLYFLSKLSLTEPSRTLFEKMANIAAEQNLIGYEFDDYNYFIIFYRRYGDYIPILLLTLGAYIVFIMILKTKRKEAILQIHKITTLVYLLLVLALLYVPSLYKSAVIARDNTFLREDPSSASGVVEVVKKGHKLTLFGSVDHWNRVIWNNRIVYIRKNDLLPI